MKTLLKDFQQNHSSLQIKMKEINQKLDYESKINLISIIKKKVKEDLNDKVYNFTLNNIISYESISLEKWKKNIETWVKK